MVTNPDFSEAWPSALTAQQRACLRGEHEPQMRELVASLSVYVEPKPVRPIAENPNIRECKHCRCLFLARET